MTLSIVRQARLRGHAARRSGNGCTVNGLTR